jgi:hypothetical protein
MPEERVSSVITRYVDTALSVYHYLYAEQLQPAFTQNYASSYTYHPSLRIRLSTQSYRDHHTNVVQRSRYIRNSELVYNTFHILSNHISRFSTQLSNLSLVSPVSFDYRSVWAYLDYTTFHVVNHYVRHHLRHAITSGALALPWYQVDRSYRSCISIPQDSSYRLASDLDCFCRFLPHLTPDTCMCHPVDLSVTPPHHFQSRRQLRDNVRFEVTTYLEQRRNIRDEIVNERARASYHPDAADHPDYFPDDSSTDVGDSDETDTENSINSSQPPSSQ